MNIHKNIKCIFCKKLIKATSKDYTNNSKIIMAKNSKNKVEHKELAKTRTDSLMQFLIGSKNTRHLMIFFLTQTTDRRQYVP